MQWYSVKDNPPPQPGQYQIYYDLPIKGVKYGVGYYGPEDTYIDDIAEFMETGETGKSNRLVWNGMYSNGDPTHWAYPPNPPGK